MIFTSQYSTDIPALDVLSYVFETDSSDPDKPLLISAEKPKESFSKREVNDLVRRIGAGLLKYAGMKEGDTVLLFAENSIWYPIIILGILCAGGVFTGANHGYTAVELKHQLYASETKCIITDRLRYATAVTAAESVGLSRNSIYILDNGTVPREGDGSRTFRSLLSHGLHQWTRITEVDKLSGRTAVLNFSSGTTGLPKACMITHRNLVANAEQTLELDRIAGERLCKKGYGTEDVHCAYVPIYHAMGLLTYAIVNVRRCCSTVVMRRFSPQSFLKSIQQFQITNLLLVPPVAVALIKHPDITLYDLSSVEHLLCGAAPMSPETSAQLEAIFNGSKAKSRQGWGLTEATMAVTLFPPDQWDPTYRSVGYLVPNMKMKILTGGGKEASYDEEGEAVVQGPNVFKGYFKNAEASREAWTADGWLRTGDRVVIQKGGLVTVVDRQKDFIKVKGFQVSPSELEGYLLEHEGVLDCAVIRVERDGEEHPQAHVVPTRDDITAESILAFMESKTAAHKRVTGGIVFTTAIPKSPSGKILRRMIKDPAKGRATTRL